MQDTIFDKIIQGEIPAHKIYEDSQTLAFLDINPINTGHTLIIPKQAVPFVWDLNDHIYNHLMKISKRLAIHLREKLPYAHVGMQIIGVDVAHAHVHLIPFNDPNQMLRSGQPAKQADLAELAAKLKITT